MSFIAIEHAFWHAGVVRVPSTRRPMRPQNLGVYSRSPLPGDALGVTTLTLTNVAVGSRYRVERQAGGALVTDGVAAASSVPLTLDRFAAGDPQNDIRIKVRKGTATPRYKPLETLATLQAAPQSIYIAQIPDE